MNFYNSLSGKGKEKYLSLWNPEIGQVVAYVNGMPDLVQRSVVMYNSSDKHTLIALVSLEEADWYETEKLIPVASLEICFDMLEELRYLVESSHMSSSFINDRNEEIIKNIKYDCDIIKGFIVIQFKDKPTRLESLQEALKWALEKEVE